MTLHKKRIPVDKVVILIYNMTTTYLEANVMTRAFSIRPSKDLRTHYAQISALARQNPVAITVNGKEDTVVQSHEDFVNQQNYITELEAKLAVYAHLAQAADDVKLGRVQNADDVFDEILGELDGINK